MNQAKRAELYFLRHARLNGYSYKVAGDNAYSSRPMGMGRYLKMISVKGDIITVLESPSKAISYRLELTIPQDFQPKD